MDTNTTNFSRYVLDDVMWSSTAKKVYKQPPISFVATVSTQTEFAHTDTSSIHNEPEQSSVWDPFSVLNNSCPSQKATDTSTNTSWISEVDAKRLIPTPNTEPANNVDNDEPLPSVSTTISHIQSPIIYKRAASTTPETHLVKKQKRDTLNPEPHATSSLDVSVINTPDSGRATSVFMCQKTPAQKQPLLANLDLLPSNITHVSWYLDASLSITPTVFSFGTPHGFVRFASIYLRGIRVLAGALLNKDLLSRLGMQHNRTAEKILRIIIDVCNESDDLNAEDIFLPYEYFKVLNSTLFAVSNLPHINQNASTAKKQECDSQDTRPVSNISLINDTGESFLLDLAYYLHAKLERSFNPRVHILIDDIRSIQLKRIAKRIEAQSQAYHEVYNQLRIQEIMEWKSSKNKFFPFAVIKNWSVFINKLLTSVNMKAPASIQTTPVSSDDSILTIINRCSFGKVSLLMSVVFPHLYPSINHAAIISIHMSKEQQDILCELNSYFNNITKTDNTRLLFDTAESRALQTITEIFSNSSSTRQSIATPVIRAFTLFLQRILSTLRDQNATRHFISHEPDIYGHRTLADILCKNAFDKTKLVHMKKYALLQQCSNATSAVTLKEYVNEYKSLMNIIAQFPQLTYLHIHFSLSTLNSKEPTALIRRRAITGLIHVIEYAHQHLSSIESIDMQAEVEKHIPPDSTQLPRAEIIRIQQSLLNSDSKFSHTCTAFRQLPGGPRAVRALSRFVAQIINDKRIGIQGVSYMMQRTLHNIYHLIEAFQQLGFPTVILPPAYHSFLKDILRVATSEEPAETRPKIIEPHIKFHNPNEHDKAVQELLNYIGEPVLHELIMFILGCDRAFTRQHKITLDASKTVALYMLTKQLKELNIKYQAHQWLQRIPKKFFDIVASQTSQKFDITPDQFLVLHNTLEMICHHTAIPVYIAPYNVGMPSLERAILSIPFPIAAQCKSLLFEYRNRPVATVPSHSPLMKSLEQITSVLNAPSMHCNDSVSLSSGLAGLKMDLEFLCLKNVIQRNIASKKASGQLVLSQLEITKLLSFANRIMCSIADNDISTYFSYNRIPTTIQIISCSPPNKQ